MKNHDFSLKGYKEILKCIRLNRYECLFFHQKTEGKNIYLRHDIDADLNAAVIMANIESEMGIKATYFVMLNSPLYNLFSRNNINNINTILNLGHEIGLHYDACLNRKNDIASSIDSDISMLDDYFGVKINAVSFHQPTKDVIDNKIAINQINTYDKEFFSDIYYISDSNMQWKNKDPISLLNSEKHKKIQLLIHPLWWMESGNCTETKWGGAIKRNFLYEQRQLLATERAYGREKKLILECFNYE